MAMPANHWRRLAPGSVALSGTGNIGLFELIVIILIDTKLSDSRERESNSLAFTQFQTT
jgi:hypothetical protein